MANTLIHLNQKADAVREFKVAMDLQPEGQIAQYCQTALRSLGALPQPAPPAQAAKAPLVVATAPVAKKYLPSIQQPQVVCIVDRSPLSQRMDMIMTDLQATYGDVIAFRRSMVNAPDEKTKEMLKTYGVRNAPAIVFIDDEGKPTSQMGGDVLEDNVRRYVQMLAKSSRWQEPGAPKDSHSLEYRHIALGELEARIGQDQLRVDQEIKDIENRCDEQIEGLRHTSTRGTTPADRAIAFEQVKHDADIKIQAIRNDFEKRKAEWRAAAEAKIEAASH